MGFLSGYTALLGKALVRTVAKAGLLGMFAHAQVKGLALFYLKYKGSDPAAFVGAITKRLFGRLATGAPRIVFSGFKFDGHGLPRCNRRFFHNDEKRELVYVRIYNLLRQNT